MYEPYRKGGGQAGGGGVGGRRWRMQRWEIGGEEVEEARGRRR